MCLSCSSQQYDSSRRPRRTVCRKGCYSTNHKNQYCVLCFQRLFTVRMLEMNSRTVFQSSCYSMNHEKTVAYCVFGFFLQYDFLKATVRTVIRSNMYSRISRNGLSYCNRRLQLQYEFRNWLSALLSSFLDFCETVKKPVNQSIVIPSRRLTALPGRAAWPLRAPSPRTPNQVLFTPF